MFPASIPTKMKLENLLKMNSEDALLYLERRVNARFPLDAEHADVDLMYRPDGSTKSFELPYVLIPTGKLQMFTSQPSQQLEKSVFNDGKLKFFVHPAMIEEYKSKGLNELVKFDGSLTVSPSSSTRTVMTIGKEFNFFIKTNLERKLGEHARKLKLQNVTHSNSICKELMSVQPINQFGYMPESIGAVYTKGSEEIGIIFREIQPRPSVQYEKYIIPFFSLYSLDKNNKEDNVLLCQILEKLPKSGGSELEFFQELIVYPLLKSWAYLLRERGLNQDLHAQNCLLELNCAGMPMRYICRDFQEFFVITNIRKAKGLHTDFILNLDVENKKIIKVDSRVVDSVEEKRIIGHSFAYDYKLGKIFDYFVIVLSKYKSCPENAVIDAIKKTFHEAFQNRASEFFSEKAYHFKPVKQEFSKEFVFMEVKPKYR